MKWLLLFILSISIPGSSDKKSCSCKKAENWEKTHWGAITALSSNKAEGTFKWLQGEVNYPLGEPVEDALVEVYDNPDALFEVGADIKALEKKQTRGAACKTGQDGGFCLGDIPSGKYELRISKEQFETRQIIVKVRSNNPLLRGKKLKIILGSDM